MEIHHNVLPFPAPHFRLLQEQLWWHTRSFVFTSTQIETPTLVRRCFAYASHAFPQYTLTRARVKLYQSGKERVRKRTESESPVLRFSFGARHKFVLEAVGNGGLRKKVVWLGSNSLLVMGGDMQEEFTHSIPKSACGPHICITLFK